MFAARRRAAPQPALRGQWAADDRTRRARTWRSRRSYQEARRGNSIASDPSSSNPHRSFVGMSRTADDIPTAIIVDLCRLDISSLRYSESVRTNLRTIEQAMKREGRPQVILSLTSRSGTYGDQLDCSDGARAISEGHHGDERIRTLGDAWRHAFGNVIAAPACFPTG